MFCSLTIKSSPIAFGFSRDQYTYGVLLRFKTVLLLEIPFGLATMADPLQECCVRYASDDSQCPPKCSCTQSLSYCADMLLQNSYCRFGVSGTTAPFALSLIQPSEVTAINSLNCSVRLQLQFSISSKSATWDCWQLD